MYAGKDKLLLNRRGDQKIDEPSVERLRGLLKRTMGSNITPPPRKLQDKLLLVSLLRVKRRAAGSVFDVKTLILEPTPWHEAGLKHGITTKPGYRP